MASEGGQRGGSAGNGVRPGKLSALLQELAAAPTPSGGGWDAVLLPGATIGKFELVREIGSGGFGVVWEARDRELLRSVAFKAVRAGGKAGLREERLLREAEAAARLSHPNIVTLFDLGRAEVGPYLVLELLQGQTLEERLAQGPLPLREAVRITAEVARGVAHAHQHGVVHRDLKPANVFLCDDGQVKVLDFGLAHAFGQRRQDGGTPAYMAPEQWEAAPEDERTDVFALGVLLYRLLSGELPFPDDGGRAVCAPGKAPAVEVPDAPALGPLVARLLEKRAAARPRDGAEVASALRSIQGELERTATAGAGPVTTRPQAGLPGLLAELRRRRVLPAMVGYGTFALLAVRGVDWALQSGRLPAWASAVALGLLALGFPASLIVAWYYDLTGQGLRRTPPRTGAEAPPRRRKAALLLAVVGILAAAPALVYTLLLRGRAPAGGTADGRVLVAVADVVNETGEKELDVLSGLLVTSLEQSRWLTVMTQARVLDLSIRAGRKDVSRVDETIGREVGRAQAVRALLLPAIRRLGSTYSLEMRAIDPVADRHLFTVSDRATSKEALLDLLDRLSERTRRELGEQKAEVGKASVQLGAAMTRSVEAYQHYLAGQEAWLRDGLRAEGLREFEEALRLDPGFAAAHGELAGLVHNAYDQSGPAGPHWKAAQAGLDRMPEKERLLFRLKLAHASPTMEHLSREEALRLADEALARFPGDKFAVTSAADAFETFDLPARWEPALRRALELDPGYSWAAKAMVDWLGPRTAEALEVARRAVATRRSPANLGVLAGALWAAGDEEGAVTAAREALQADGGRNSLVAARACDVLREKRLHLECLPMWRRMAEEGQNPYERDYGRFQLASLLAFQGKVREALRTLEPAAGRGAPPPGLLFGIHQVGRPRLDAPKAIDAARRVSHPQLRRNFLSFLGAWEEADRITVALEGKGYELVEKVNDYYPLARAGRFDEAVQVMRQVREEIHRRNYPVSLYGAPLLEAEALLAAGRVAETAAVWPRPLPCRCTDLFDYALQYPRLALLRARAKEQLGRRADAIRELDGVISFWKEADQDLPLLVEAEAMRKRLARAPSPAKKAAAMEATPSIAVLPFTDMSPGKDEEYFADGVAEEILNALARVKELKVVGRTSSFSFKGKGVDLPTIGRRLGVSAVLQGSVRRDAGRVRIAAQLVKTADGFHLWSETYDRELGGIFAVQDEIAGQVVAQVGPLLAGRPPAATPTRLDAYESVLRGRARAAAMEAASMQLALEEFERAAALAPDYAPAHQGRCWAQVGLVMLGDPADPEGLLRRGQAACDRAIALDPGMASAFIQRALARQTLADWRGARADVEQALAIDPGGVGSVAGTLLLEQGDDPVRALSLLQLAVERDPLSAGAWTLLGGAHRDDGRLEEARRAYQRALALAPANALAIVGMAAVAYQERSFAEARGYWRRAHSRGARLYGEALVAHAEGDDAGSRRALAELVELEGGQCGYRAGLVHAVRGERDQAFACLERAVAQRSLNRRYLVRAWPLRSLRADPRWAALLRKVNLPVE